MTQKVPFNLNVATMKLQFSKNSSDFKSFVKISYVLIWLIIDCLGFLTLAAPAVARLCFSSNVSKSVC